MEADSLRGIHTTGYWGQWLGLAARRLALTLKDVGTEEIVSMDFHEPQPQLGRGRLVGPAFLRPKQERPETCQSFNATQRRMTNLSLTHAVGVQ